VHPEASDRFAALFNAAAAGVQGRVHLAAHLCFGNMSGRPLSRRLYRPVLQQALAFDVGELVLEFANREMAELDVAVDVTAAGRHLSAGVVDVKNYYLETADDVAWRIDRLLEAGVPEAQLSVVPDCGFTAMMRKRRLLMGNSPIVSSDGRTSAVRAREGVRWPPQAAESQERAASCQIIPRHEAFSQLVAPERRKVQLAAYAASAGMVNSRISHCFFMKLSAAQKLARRSQGSGGNPNTSAGLSTKMSLRIVSSGTQFSIMSSNATSFGIGLKYWGCGQSEPQSRRFGACCTSL
jgi:hypothetical protein